MIKSSICIEFLVKIKGSYKKRKDGGRASLEREIIILRKLCLYYVFNFENVAMLYFLQKHGKANLFLLHCEKTTKIPNAIE